MITLGRILLPTDFSGLASHALSYACDLARAYRAELHVLHVVSPAKEIPVAIDGGGGVGTAMHGAVLLESVHDVVLRKERELRTHIAGIGSDLPVEPIAVVRAGLPWSEIVRYADEVAIDLIVIGSHARGVMKRILLGSTSKSVLEHTGRPVLMVPTAAVRDEPAPAPDNAEAIAGASA